MEKNFITKKRRSKNNLERLKNLFIHPAGYMAYFLELISPCIKNDELYLRIMWRLRLGTKLHLKNPQTFNEKLQWLKLHDRRPEYTKMVDKYEAKKYVANIIGDEYIIPTLGVWDNFDEINFDSLPNQFVLKCTHDSGGLVICRDKKTLDLDAVKKKINKCLKRNYYWGGREWPYKNVKPRIIAEKFMTDESGSELKDYKIFNFNGKAKIIQVDFNRFREHMKNLYTTQWAYIDVNVNYPTNPDHQIAKPEKLEKMLEFAEKLSADIPFLRTDFYSVEDKIYFGELTFFPGSGYMTFNPEKFGYTMGSWIQIPDGGGF